MDSLWCLAVPGVVATLVGGKIWLTHNSVYSGNPTLRRLGATIRNVGIAASIFSLYTGFLGPVQVQGITIRRFPDWLLQLTSRQYLGVEIPEHVLVASNPATEYVENKMRIDVNLKMGLGPDRKTFDATVGVNYTVHNQGEKTINYIDVAWKYGDKRVESDFKKFPNDYFSKEKTTERRIQAAATAKTLTHRLNGPFLPHSSTKLSFDWPGNLHELYYNTDSPRRSLSVVDAKF